MTTHIIMGSQLRYEVSDSSHVGTCRRAAKELSERHGADESISGKASIVATELANNIVRHAGSGEMLIQILEDGVSPQLEILAIDRGQGMIDVSKCLQDGYSTAGTMGTGLGAVSRFSAEFDIFSVEDGGTVVLSRIPLKKNYSSARQPSNRATLEMGAISIPVAGEIECGDTWRAASDDNNIAMLVVDGLGHGPQAAAASQAAAAAFGSMPFDSPAQMMKNLHEILIGSRGAAAACALLNKATEKIEYAGIGNICSSVVVSERPQGMVSHNGILGVQMPSARQFAYEWPSGQPMIMHSDGISTRWSLSAYPGLSIRHPAIIAAVLYRDFSRKRDDATVLVARYRGN